MIVHDGELSINDMTVDSFTKIFPDITRSSICYILKPGTPNKINFQEMEKIYLVFHKFYPEYRLLSPHEYINNYDSLKDLFQGVSFPILQYKDFVKYHFGLAIGEHSLLYFNCDNRAALVITKRTRAEWNKFLLWIKVMDSLKDKTEI